MSPCQISWQDCNVVTQTYSIVDGHELKCDIVVPPKLQPGKHPLLIAFHGGYLITGARDVYLYLGNWIPGYAAASSAVILSPDHRLLPSADAGVIREDLEKLWSWVEGELPLVVQRQLPGHEIDLNRIVLEGHSAGGFCAVHLAMSHPDQVKAVMLTYPMLHNLSDHLAKGSPDPPSEHNGMKLLEGIELDAKIEKARREGWVSSRRSPEDAKLTISMVVNGRFGKFFGPEQNDPIYRVLHGEGRGLPSKTWILHGKEDTGVPVQGSIDFTAAVKKSDWVTDIILDVVDGEPSHHGFDKDWTIDNPKLKDRLEWISRSW